MDSLAVHQPLNRHWLKYTATSYNVCTLALSAETKTNGSCFDSNSATFSERWYLYFPPSSLANKMQRKVYCSTIKELLCSYITVDVQCLHKLQLQSFYFPQDDSTQPGRSMCIKPYTDFPWDSYPRCFKQLNAELYDHFNPGNSFHFWRSSSLLLLTTLQPIVRIIISLHVVCQTRNISRWKQTCPSHSTPSHQTIHPVWLPYSCDTGAPAQGREQDEAAEGQNGFRNWGEHGMEHSSHEVAIPEPVSSQPTPH